MQRGGNLVIFAGQTLHDPRRARMAVRNAERIEERLGLFFPTLIQHLNELAAKWPLGLSKDDIDSGRTQKSPRWPLQSGQPR
jgi:hypothetical protein